MKLLLDTHAVIWFITEDDQLPEKSKNLIQDPNNVCMISIASLWEMGIKYSLGKLDLKADLKKIFDIVDESGITLLPINPAHILTCSVLEFQIRAFCVSKLNRIESGITTFSPCLK